jgi:hypothetical protein
MAEEGNAIFTEQYFRYIFMKHKNNFNNKKRDHVTFQLVEDYR